MNLGVLHLIVIVIVISSRRVGLRLRVRLRAEGGSWRDSVEFLSRLAPLNLAGKGPSPPLGRAGVASARGLPRRSSKSEAGFMGRPFCLGTSKAMVPCRITW